MFLHQIGFEPTNRDGDIEILKSQLIQEQKHVSRAKQALTHAETRYMLLKHQNEACLQMARHFHEQLQSLIDQQQNQQNQKRNSSNNDIAAMNVQLSPAWLQSTQNMLRDSREMLFRGSRSVESEQMYEELNDTMEDDDSSSEEDEGNVASDDNDDVDVDFHEDNDMLEDSDSESMDDHIMEEISSPQERFSGGNAARQIRTVSISSSDP